MWGKDAVIPMLQAPPLAWGYRQRRAAARRWSRAPPLDNVIEIQKYRTERSELGGSQIHNQGVYVVISHLQRSGCGVYVVLPRLRAGPFTVRSAITRRWRCRSRTGRGGNQISVYDLSSSFEKEMSTVSPLLLP